MLKTRDGRDFWVLALVALVVIGAGIGLRQPWPADEPRFVLVAQQMWASGDWLFPHRGQELYPDKPPLFFWLLCASYALVCDWTLAFLIPSLLAALGTLALTYDLARRLWDRRIGLWAAGAVLCALQFVYQAKHAQIDPTVTFLITLGVYGIGRHVLCGPNWRWYWFGCFAAGLGVISKGVGFLALLALIPYGVLRWRQWRGLSEPKPRGAGRWALGAAAFLAAIAVWFVPMIVTAMTDHDPQHDAYVRELLFHQTATRYVNAWHHTEPSWYFLEVIALTWLPFSIFLPWLFKPWRDAWRTRDARIWWPLLWALLVLVFFSASPGKRDMYILPALPAIALAAAPFLPALAQRRGVQWALWLFTALLGVGLLGAGAAAIYGDPHFETSLEASRGVADDRLWYVLAAMGAALCGAALWLRPARAVALTLAAMMVLWCGYGIAIAPLLDAQSSGRALMVEARERAGSDATIGLVDWREQQLLQAVGPVTEFGFRASGVEQWARAMPWLRADPTQRWLLVQAGSLPECVVRENAQALGTSSRRSFWLLPAEAVPVGCLLAEKPRHP